MFLLGEGGLKPRTIVTENSQQFSAGDLKAPTV